jgi:hypothetical protein
MILSCDPPRHAFLIHFGKRQQPPTVEIVRSGCRRAEIELAINPTTPPSLVAIHFVRHGFWLPFVSVPEGSVNPFHLRYGWREKKFLFHFSFNPKDCEQWEICPGLTVLTSGPVRYEFGSSDSVEERAILRGLLVDTQALASNIDTSEFLFELDTDNLKNVPVDLFFTKMPVE